MRLYLPGPNVCFSLHGGGVRASDCAAAGHSFCNVRWMLGKGKANSPPRVTMDHRPGLDGTIVRSSIDLSRPSTAGFRILRSSVEGSRRLTAGVTQRFNENRSNMTLCCVSILYKRLQRNTFLVISAKYPNFLSVTERSNLSVKFTSLFKKSAIFSRKGPNDVESF